MRAHRPHPTRTLLACLPLLLAGCTPRSGAHEGATIVVQEFEIPRSAVVERYDAPHDHFGMRYAEMLAKRLTRLGYQATAVPAGVPLEGDLRVTGKIMEIDGGSTAKRLLIGFGAGTAQFDVYGSVTRADGSVVGEFTESRAGGGWSKDGSTENAMQRTVNVIAKMIYTGSYQRNAPQHRPAAEAYRAAASPTTDGSSTAERLQTLDQLRADGMVTPDEYQAKRRAIIDDL